MITDPRVLHCTRWYLNRHVNGMFNDGSMQIKSMVFLISNTKNYYASIYSTFLWTLCKLHTKTQKNLLRHHRKSDWPNLQSKAFSNYHFLVSIVGNDILIRMAIISKLYNDTSGTTSLKSKSIRCLIQKK